MPAEHLGRKAPNGQRVLKTRVRRAAGTCLCVPIVCARGAAAKTWRWRGQIYGETDMEYTTRSRMPSRRSMGSTRLCAQKTCPKTGAILTNTCTGHSVVWLVSAGNLRVADGICLVHLQPARSQHVSRCADASSQTDAWSTLPRVDLFRFREGSDLTSPGHTARLGWRHWHSPTG
jgi:hypothetical protein